MKVSERKILLFAFIVFISFSFVAQNKDSLYFAQLREFYEAQCGRKLSPKLFGIKAVNDALPFYYIFASEKNKVKNVVEKAFEYADQDSAKARKISNGYIQQGKSTFIYHTFGTSQARITKGLLSYSKESQCYVVFHELTHNYIIDERINVNYELNEAASDVLGIELSKKLLKQGKAGLDKKKFETMENALKDIYKCILKAKEGIDKDSLRCERICKETEQKIKQALIGCDAFFIDRFNYPVNTAFILKNMNYCTYYFQLRKMYTKKYDFIIFMQDIMQYNYKLHEKK